MSEPVIIPLDATHAWVRYGLAEPLFFCLRCPAQKVIREAAPLYSGVFGASLVSCPPACRPIEQLEAA